MVSPELMALASRGASKRSYEAAFLPDQDVHVNALVGVLRELADGVQLRQVLSRAVGLGLRPDAFPDLLDIIDPPPPPPKLLIENAVNAARVLLEVAENAADDARAMIDVYVWREL